MSASDPCAVVPVLFPQTEGYTSNAVKYTGAAFFVFAIAGVSVYTPMFFYYRNQGKFLRVRQSFGAVCFSTAAVVCYSIAVFFTLWQGADRISCDVQLVLMMVVVPLSSMPALARLLAFWNGVVFTKRVAELNVDEIVARNSKMKVTSTLGLVRKASKEALKRTFSKSKLSKEHKVVEQAPAIKEEMFDELVEEGGSVPGSPGGRSQKSDQSFSTFSRKTGGYVLRRFLSTKLGYLVMTSTFLLPFLFMTISLLYTEDYYRAGCSGCRLSQTENLVVVCMMAVVQALGMAGCFMLRKFDDPFLIVSELWWVFGFGGNLALIGYSLYTVFQEYPALQFITGWGIICMYAFQAPWLLVVAKLKMRRKRGAFRTDKSAVKATMTLEDGMASPKILLGYERHLIAEMGIESLRFYNDAKAFQARARDMTQKTRNLRAQKLARVYIGANAVLAINISQALMHKIQAEIAEDIETGETPAEVFDAAIDEVFTMMSKGSWLRYLRTPAFAEAKKAEDGAMGGAV